MLHENHRKPQTSLLQWGLGLLSFGWLANHLRSLVSAANIVISGLNIVISGFSRLTSGFESVRHI